VREVMKEDSPTPAGARSEARQGRFQSLVRAAVKEDARAGGRAVGGPPGAIAIAGA